MSNLSHQGAYRLIHKRELTGVERQDLHQHLQECAACRQHADAVAYLARHLTLGAVRMRPNSSFTDAYLRSAQRHTRRNQFMKPIYAVGGIAVVVLLALAGWFIVRPNLESTAVAPEAAEPTVTTLPPTIAPTAVLEPPTATPLPRDEIPRISPEELKNLLDNGEDVLVVDTRGKIPYDYVHLPGAIMAPEDYDDFPHDKAIVFYCDCINESQSAGPAVELYKIGFTNVSALLGGISAWEDADYPVEGSSAN